MTWNTEEKKKHICLRKQVSYIFVDKNSYLNLQMKKNDNSSSVSPNEHLQWHIIKNYGIIAFKVSLNMLQNYCTPISTNHKLEANFVCKGCLVNSWLIPPGNTFITSTQKNNCVWIACCGN